MQLLRFYYPLHRLLLGILITPSVEEALKFLTTHDHVGSSIEVQVIGGQEDAYRLLKAIQAVNSL